MTGKCDQQRVGCRKDKEYDREIEKNGSQDDDVVQIWTDESNNPTCRYIQTKELPGIIFSISLSC